MIFISKIVIWHAFNSLFFAQFEQYFERSKSILIKLFSSTSYYNFSLFCSFSIHLILKYFFFINHLTKFNPIFSSVCTTILHRNCIPSYRQKLDWLVSSTHISKLNAITHKCFVSHFLKRSLLIESIRVSFIITFLRLKNG